MANNLKQVKPMSCPICDKFYFTKLTKEEIDDGETPNQQQCSSCGWFYDLEQLNDPNLKNESNEMSLNEYKEWYKNKIKENRKWEYYLDFIGEPEPHICPLCGEYTFKDLLTYDICPVCGYQDDGNDEFPDDKGHPLQMTFNERKLWFAEQRKLNPKFKAHPRTKRK